MDAWPTVFLSGLLRGKIIAMKMQAAIMQLGFLAHWGKIWA